MRSLVNSLSGRFALRYKIKHFAHSPKGHRPEPIPHSYNQTTIDF